MFLGAASGILFGVSDVVDQGAHRRDRPLRRARPRVALAPRRVAASVIAFYASARGLQSGEAVPVIALTSAGANVSAIAGGILVFGDPMAEDPVGDRAPALAFILVIAAPPSCPRRCARLRARLRAAA